MDNKSFYTSLTEKLLPYIGKYSRSNGVLPAFSYDSGKREQNVEGLEVILEPLVRSYVRNAGSKHNGLGFAVHLIQHEGRTTIGQANEALYQMGLELGMVNYMSRNVSPDAGQDILPASLWMMWFIAPDDCCEKVDSAC